MTPNENGGFIIVRGARPDVEEAIEALRTFDTPFLSDRVTGLFEIRNADVQTVRAEVETVMKVGDRERTFVRRLHRASEVELALRCGTYPGAVRARPRLDRTA